MENKGFKVETDSDEQSEDVGEESGDEEGKGVKKEKIKKMEQSKEHKPIQKSAMEVKKAQFLGEKFGHYKMGSYVRIEIQIEKKFSR